METDPVHSEAEPYAAEQPVWVSHFVHILQRYGTVILLSLVAVGLMYLIVAVALLLLAPTQTVTSMPFRLEFRGAEQGYYPNGVRFSVADITVTPVLLQVFNTNDLGRFIPFERFGRSVVVLESNEQLQMLAAEYQSKLSDVRLTPVDRERLQREFDSKRASISKSSYSLQLILTGESRIPPSLRGKILHDTLASWARKAAVERRALDYNIPVLSANVLDQIRIIDESYLVPLLLLRRRLLDLMQNVDKVAEIPGAGLVRTEKDRVSVAEVRLAVEEIIRFRIEPIINASRSRGVFDPTETALDILEAQLSYDERVLEELQRREQALQMVLAAYESQQGQTRTTIPLRGEAGGEARGRSAETVMPQLTDSFLERIVEMSNRNADREYRQELTDEIKAASLAIGPAEMAVKYDRELVEAFRRSPQRKADPAAAAALKAEWNDLLNEVRQTIRRLTEIYTLASGQLYPESHLYRTLGPVVTSTQRTASPIRLALGGILTFLLAIPLVIGAVLLHNRVREEEAMEGSPAP